jgi:hypothetical protein
MNNRHRIALAMIALAAASCDFGNTDLDTPGDPESGAGAETREALLRARRCAGPRGLECPAGQYCKEAEVGRCPSKSEYGVCAAKPEVCTKIFAPVCGCDGQTYSNSCMAAVAGVAVASEGACPGSCRSNADCPAKDQFCSFEPGRCGGTGKCEARPEICPLIFRPVCGCDGKTYGNSCEAAAAGVSVSHDGACRPQGPFCGGIAGIPCPEDLACVDDPSDDCDPKNGGADCGGICVPRTPNPCATVLCQTGTQCVVKDGQPICVPRGGPTCGSNVCPAGQVCCNASCGICTPPGGACIQVICDQAK